MAIRFMHCKICDADKVEELFPRNVRKSDVSVCKECKGLEFVKRIERTKKDYTLKKNSVPWNKGLTKETNESVARCGGGQRWVRFYK